MRMGLYTLGALSFILIIGAFVYTLELGTYRLEVLNIALPITIWVVLPLVFLYLLTIGHMFFYGVRNYFKIKKWEKDTDHLEDALYWSLVNEPKAQKYAMGPLKDTAILLSKASLDVSDNIETLRPRLAKVVNLLQKIKKGEYVDLKEEKLAKVFKEGNPILKQNRLNRLSADDKFVEEVMKSTSSYSKDVQNQALKIFAKKEDFVKARKYIKMFDVQNFLVLLKRVNSDNELGLTQEILTDFVQELKLSCADFISVAKVTKKYFKPDENLGLFLAYQKENPKAQNAYLYLLFEYELTEQVGAYLEEHEEDDFTKFRAFYQLKSENSGYNFSDIIDVDTVCNETKYI